MNFKQIICKNKAGEVRTGNMNEQNQKEEVKTPEISENEKLYSHILDSMPFQIVFIDKDFIVRYMNREAMYQNFQVLGYKDIRGKSIFDCHKNPKSHERIRQLAKEFEQNAPEKFSSVTDRNERLYFVPVRDENGEYIGMYERTELNLQR